MKPTIVFALGGWPLVESANPLKAAFEKLSYTFVCKTRPKEIDKTLKVNPDTIFLRDEVLTPLVDDGTDVVLVMHSYGGAYGASAVQNLSKAERVKHGKAGGIIAMVFVTAYVARQEETAIEAMGFDRDNLPELFHHDKLSGAVKFVKAKEVLFQNFPEEEAEKLAAQLPDESFSSFDAEVTYDPYDDSFHEGKIGYIRTGADPIIPLKKQEEFADKAKAAERVTLEGASHAPHLEQPDLLAKTVIEIVGKLTAA